MRPLLAVVWSALILVPAASARAQADVYEPEASQFTFNVGGGFSFVAGDAGDTFDSGGAFQIGGGYRARPELAFQVNYFYSRYDVEERALPDANLDADHTLQYLALEAVFEPLRLEAPVSFYVVGGPGLYYRVVSVREITGTAVVPYCDPWLFYCSAAAVETSEVLGTRDDWNFGLGGGVGVLLRLSPYAGLFLEGRYHYVWGQEFTDAEGDRRSADTQYIPVVAGFRF